MVEELNMLLFQGLMIIYLGGGFIVDFGYNIDDVLCVIDNLEINDWIDNMMVVVFVEFIIYQLVSFLFSVVKFLFERFLSGGINIIIEVKMLMVYLFKDLIFCGFYEICYLLFMLFIFICVGNEIGKVY